jgi:hypothetical protein
MEALLVPIADIIKRYVQINYLNFEDQQLNLAFYALLGISIALISKLIIFIFTDEDLIKKYKWYWEYKILKKTSKEDEINAKVQEALWQVYERSYLEEVITKCQNFHYTHYQNVEVRAIVVLIDENNVIC